MSLKSEEIEASALIDQLTNDLTAANLDSFAAGQEKAKENTNKALTQMKTKLDRVKKYVAEETLPTTLEIVNFLGWFPLSSNS